ncbi:hypothetical protein ACTHSJ_14525 [Paenibacillus cellulositrophicus]
MKAKEAEETGRNLRKPKKPMKAEKNRGKSSAVQEAGEDSLFVTG